MEYPQTSFETTKFLSPSFISRKRQIVFHQTLPYQLQVLKDTGRYDAFKLKWHKSYNDTPDVWPVPNHLFWDSDVAKWIEGACYFLSWQENPEIDASVKELVDMIRSAQQPDGYLNIHFTVVEPDKRFSNLRDLHELYNAGHLIEAALAHNKLYGNDLLLEPLIKYVDLLAETFGPGPNQKHGYPGHPEIELSLIRLHQRTKNPKHLELARYFIEERGNPTGQDGRHYYDVEAVARDERENEMPQNYLKKRSYWYTQAHKPILEQDTIEGHSVRAMYLLTAVADLVRIQGCSDVEGYKTACERLWNNMVDKRMYMTGGIGVVNQYEGFSIDFFLPQGTDEGGCYAETCAAIGVMMLAERLLQIDLDGKYGDVMELCFYNAVMTGMSASGKQFTYVNQLASSDTDLSQRQKWFTCACCPPNVSRLLGYIGGYLWSSHVKEKAVEINVHLYDSATIEILMEGGAVKLQQSSNWPWDSTISFALESPEDIKTTVRLRIPGWADEWKLSSSYDDLPLEKGYLTLTPDWLKQNFKFELDIRLKPRLISPHPFTNQEIIALARGPLIYCVEDVDNEWVDDHFKSLILDPLCRLSEQNHIDEGTNEPYVKITAHNGAYILNPGESSIQGLPFRYINKVIERGPSELHFIPYYFRDNRGGKGHMRVGLRRRY